MLGHFFILGQPTNIIFTMWEHRFFIFPHFDFLTKNKKTMRKHEIFHPLMTYYHEITSNGMLPTSSTMYKWLIVAGYVVSTMWEHGFSIFSHLNLDQKQGKTMRKNMKKYHFSHTWATYKHHI